MCILKKTTHITNYALYNALALLYRTVLFFKAFNKLTLSREV